MSEVDWPLRRNIIRRGADSNTFGMVRRKADGSPRPHQGWDLEAVIGTPIFAIGSGMVRVVAQAGAYGLIIVHSFTHDGRELFAAYCHLSRADVKQGDRVTLGQVIGATGESGNAQGMALADQHLHFEIRTVPLPGLGLNGRKSPLDVFGVCPLHAAILRGR